MSSHPLMEVRFVRHEVDDGPIIRNWYHVPSPRDFVSLDDENPPLEGEVVRVMWCEDYVIVEVRKVR